MNQNNYQLHGYTNRDAYLQGLAETYGLDLDDVVQPIADLLGPSEDFDGLISMLEDEAAK